MNAEDLLKALKDGFAARANQLSDMETVCEGGRLKQEELRLRSLAMLDMSEGYDAALQILRR